MTDRRQDSYKIRVSAAELARDRVHPEHLANGDEQKYASANYAMSFTKGLGHNPDTGLVAEPGHFEAFRRAIDGAFIDPFTLNVPRFAGCKGDPRKWEAPTAGVVHDLEGPDAQAVTMPPAPELGSDELAYEMAEVYELPLLGDVPLGDLRAGAGNPKVGNAIKRLNDLAYKPASGTGRPRYTDKTGKVTEQTVFRGSSPGVEMGPYLSQFMLIGNVDQPGTMAVRDGKIAYGALLIDQRVPVAKSDVDYMTGWDDWLTVQNGCEVQNNSKLFDPNSKRRFITTPRDMATYVHYDALYEAYLNACLILTGMNAPFDPAFANLSGQDHLYLNKAGGGTQTFTRQTGGFALYGGPHILTLVTEVATRALKAVRYQKFNNHLRLRPEALAARIEKAVEIDKNFPATCGAFTDLR